jgi:sialate O-acetylesterase
LHRFLNLGGNGLERMPLPGDWRYKAACIWPRDSQLRRPALPVSPTAAGNRPGSLYNGMLAPLAGYGIKGVLWYQGESNADRARAYQALLPLLHAFRAEWQAHGRAEHRRRDPIIDNKDRSP